MQFNHSVSSIGYNVILDIYHVIMFLSIHYQFQATPRLYNMIQKNSLRVILII